MTEEGVLLRMTEEGVLLRMMMGEGILGMTVREAPSDCHSEPPLVIPTHPLSFRTPPCHSERSEESKICL